MPRKAKQKKRKLSPSCKCWDCRYFHIYAHRARSEDFGCDRGIPSSSLPRKKCKFHEEDEKP